MGGRGCRRRACGGRRAHCLRLTAAPTALLPLLLCSCSIVHGDLKPQNVLLKSATADRRGYVCKVGRTAGTALPRRTFSLASGGPALPCLVLPRAHPHRCAAPSSPLQLADFGLSRMLHEGETHVDTGNYGTVTHASKELLLDGRLTKSSDVFAFGRLCWELVTGQKLFPGMNHMQVRRVQRGAPLLCRAGCKGLRRMT